MADDPRIMNVAGQELLSTFAAYDSVLDAREVQATALRKEFDDLMVGWSDLVASSDYAEIAARSKRRQEIRQQLAALGF